MKIEEFVEFRERLSSSMHYALVTVERMLLDILHSTAHPEMLKVFFKFPLNLLNARFEET